MNHEISYVYNIAFYREFSTYLSYFSLGMKKYCPVMYIAILLINFTVFLLISSDQCAVVEC